MTSSIPPEQIMRRMKQGSTIGCNEALSEILQSFEDRDIRNFLFTNEAIEQPFYNDPNLSKSSITVTLSSKRYCEERIEHVRGYVVYIPAFNISNKLLGFSYHYSYQDNEKKSSARFVHDYITGTFTTVITSDHGLIITLKKYLRTTYHKAYTACFQRECFLDVEALTVETVVGGLKEICVGVELRDCPYCGHGACNCCVRMKIAKHPFDEAVFRDGIALLIGCFKGVAQVVSYDNGGTKTENVRVVTEVREARKDVIMEGLGLYETGVVRGKNVKAMETDVVNELKAVLRRERNRVAARKSNMKKKLLNDGLKAAVLGERLRLEQLRTKELELRRKNLELRRLLALKEG